MKNKIINIILVVVSMTIALFNLFQLGYDLGFDKGAGLPEYYFVCPKLAEVEHKGLIKNECIGDLTMYSVVKY